MLVIAAAGNSGAGGYEYPASYPTVVSIGAVNSNKQRAGFSTFNDQVELSGPGVGVLSTLPENQYRSWSGTSMVRVVSFHALSLTSVHVYIDRLSNQWLTSKYCLCL